MRSGTTRLRGAKVISSVMRIVSLERLAGLAADQTR